MAALVAPTVASRAPDHPAVWPRISRRGIAAPPSAAGVVERPTVGVLSAHDATRQARTRALATGGLRVVAVGTIVGARSAVAAGVDGLLLDRWAPDGDVLTLVDELSGRAGAPSVVVVTLGAADRERVEVLVAGADDVVSSDVPETELVARVRRLVSPAVAPRGSRSRRLVAGCVTIDQDRRTVRVDGSEVALSPTQYRILVDLAAEGGRPVSTRTLVQRCWDAFEDTESCAVRTQVARLRRALGDAVEIRCVRGQGYRLAGAEA